MAGQIFGLPFDDDIFVNAWMEEPNTVKSAIRSSGAMVEDPVITARLGSDGNLITIPFYKALDGEPVNYDGKTDITTSEVGGDTMSAVAFGRAKGWSQRDFVKDLSTGDPMASIVRKVASYWDNQRQKMLLGILDGVFSIENDPDWKKHTMDVSKTASKGVLIEPSIIADLATDTLGDNKSAYGLLIMHSKVASTLEKLQMLDFWKFTTPDGMTRPLSVGSCQGYTVVVDDSVPVDTTTTGFYKYTTYLLGNGVLRHGNGALEHPVETERDPAKNGGMDFLYTRIRECIHPNGFTFVVPKSGFGESPSNAILFDKGNWKRMYDAKAIPMARLITNG